jgi:hypothetical protein
LEGNQFNPSGETTTVTPGTYRLYFSNVAGLEAPKSRTVFLAAGRMLEIEAAYGTLEPVISTHALRVAGLGLPYYAPIEVLNLPTLVVVEGLAGSGLEYNPQLRVIQGEPAVIGTFPIRVTATNAGGSDQRDLTLDVRNTATLQLTFDPALGRTADALTPRTLIVPLDTVQEITAKPFRGAVFAGWNGTGIDGLPTISPTIAFIITGNVSLNAQFTGNPFPLLGGEYLGVLSPTLGPVENNGFARVRVSRGGAFTAAVRIGAERRGLIGSFAGDGSARGTLKLRHSAGELAVALNLDVSGVAHQITILLEGAETRIEGVAGQID